MSKEQRKSGSILIIAMLIMVVISGISVTIYSLGKSNQRQASSSSNSENVHNNAINAAQFAINNLKLTPQQSSSAPPTCNSKATCQAAPQGSGKIAFAWQQGTVASTLGRTPNLVNDGEALSFWQNYAYPIPGKTTDYVLVQVNGTTSTGTLYSIVGYSNVNGNVATYSTTYYWAAYPCDCVSIVSSPSALPSGNLIANYGYWWNNNTAATQKAGGQIAYNGGLLYIGLPETTTVTKAWLDPTGGACCNAYCRWDYSIPVVGRYVQIYFEGGTAQNLNLYELQVFDQNNNNIALNKTVAMSSCLDTTNYPGSKLVDGSTSSMAHTNASADEWIQVDLGSDQTISQIKLYNRTDCCGNRIDGAKLAVTTSNNSSVYDYTFSNGAGTSIYTINPPTTNVQVVNVSGRYVFLYSNSTTNTGFNIKEIQVFDGTNTNIASTATVYMSSVASGAANNVKDGNTTTAVTTNDYKPWVLLDFGSNKIISKMVIYTGASIDRARIGIIDGTSNSFVYRSAPFLNTSAGTYTVIPQTGATVSSVSARWVNLTYFWKTSNLQLTTNGITAYNGASAYSGGTGNASSINQTDYGSNQWYWCTDTGQCWSGYCSQGGATSCQESNFGYWGGQYAPWCDNWGNCNASVIDNGSDNRTYFFYGCTVVGTGKSGQYTAYLRRWKQCWYWQSNWQPTCGQNSNITDNNSGTGACTNSEASPWMQLDLGSDKTITKVTVDTRSGIQNAQIQLYNNAGTLVYNSAPFFFSQASYTMNITVPSTTIPTAYKCVNASGDGAVSVTAGSSYPRCVGYGMRTGTNANGSITIPSTYVP